MNKCGTKSVTLMVNTSLLTIEGGVNLSNRLDSSALRMSQSQGNALAPLGMDRKVFGTCGVSIN